MVDSESRNPDDDVLRDDADDREDTREDDARDEDRKDDILEANRLIGPK